MRIDSRSYVVPYPIDGDTLRAAHEAMVRFGPLDGDGHRRFAFTWVGIDWRYPFSRERGVCLTGEVVVEVEVAQSLPEWRNLGRADAESAAEWRRWLRAIEQHEAGHVAIGMRAAKEVAAAMERVEGHPRCDETDAAANSAGHAVLERMKQRHREFDRVTANGELTGAKLRLVPPRGPSAPVLY